MTNNEQFVKSGDDKYKINYGRKEKWTDGLLSVDTQNAKQIVKFEGQYFVRGNGKWQSFSGINFSNPIFYKLNENEKNIGNPVKIADNQYLVIKNGQLYALEFGGGSNITMYSLEGDDGIGFLDEYSSLSSYYLFSLDNALYKVEDWQKYSSNSR